MNDLNYEQRLSEWSTFRDSLEASEDPLQDVINYYNKIPTVSIQTDPYTPSTWPSPWELINENMYCDFCRVLGMCYSLQLTDRFKGTKFEIHIGINKTKREVKKVINDQNNPCPFQFISVFSTIPTDSRNKYTEKPSKDDPKAKKYRPIIGKI